MAPTAERAAPPPPVAREEPAPSEADDLDERDERKLSPSQKRRLRRRRRAERERAETGVPETRIEVAAAPLVEEDDLEDLGDELREDVEDAVADEEDDFEEAVAEVTIEERPRERGRRRRPRYRDDEAEDDESPLDAPSVPRQMIINVVPGEECRIAILANDRLDEIYLERASAENHVGNIYKGVVTNVEPSIQAAFVDFGLGKNGFLHISDLHPKYFPRGSHPAEKVGRKMPRRTRPPIQQCLRRGQEVIVQISKEGIGTKGPTLNTYLSIPGRYLVMMPGMRKLGVSRRIEDDDSRTALKAVLGALELPEDMGFIARTAAIGRSQRELQGDLRYLQRLWERVEKRREKLKAPAELYRETDLVIRTIRDVFSSDITEIMVDDEATAERARDFLSVFSPKSADTVKVYDQTTPIFHKYQIESELERLHSRHVPLKSGGSLVIDSTEALVAIDVNSGRFRTEADAEQTAFKINVEAADEITRQLRLRDLGGVIVCDFIDMREERHKREIERRLIRNLRAHKERAKVLRMSSFGIIELTRQRQRASLTRSVYQDCHHCRGTGLVKTAESVALDVMRLLQLSVTRDAVQTIEVTVSPEVAEGLLNRKRSAIYQLETAHERTIQVRPSAAHSLDQVVISCLDGRGRPVAHA
ncbi:MAG: Rne/Rng family ribonuclease [Phycisphaerales bacterium]|nr:Rne/Rng family ribonuclease [Phycisphaerales bacterium]